MREFDDLDILLHSTLQSDAALPYNAAAAQRVLRERIVQHPRVRAARWFNDSFHVMLDGMLLRGANEPVYPMPLESVFFKTFRFAL